MAYPPSSQDASLTGSNKLSSVPTHSTRHNSLANAINDIVTELGSDPKGGSADLTARLTAIESGNNFGTIIASTSVVVGVTTNGGHAARFRGGAAPSGTLSTDVEIGAGKVNVGGRMTAGAITCEGDASLSGGNYVYLRGDSGTDGSVRMYSDASGSFKVQARAAGVWGDILSAS